MTARNLAATQTERQTQVPLVRWLRLVLPVGSVVAAVKNEERGRAATPEQRMRFGQALKASGVLTGFPDLICLLPGGTGFLVEVKRPVGGVVSDAQDGLHTRLWSMGWPVIIATSQESARYGLQQLGVRLREAPGQPIEVPRFRVERPKVPRLVDDAVPF